MRIGDLRDIVDIHTHSGVRDSAGQLRGDLVFFCRSRAKVNFPPGMAQVRADMNISSRRISVTLRQGQGVLPGMFLTYEGIRYEVKSTVPNQLKRTFIDLVCEG